MKLVEAKYLTSDSNLQVRFFTNTLTPMAQDTTIIVYNNTIAITDQIQKHYLFNLAFSKSLYGGAILQVTNLAKVKIPEEAGACTITVYYQIPTEKFIVSRMFEII